MMMGWYSAALAVGLALSAPWWLLRMLTTERYREGMRERLGGVPAALRKVVRGRRVVWVHAVSVGEVLAATRLVTELETALGAGAGDSGVLRREAPQDNGEKQATAKASANAAFFASLRNDKNADSVASLRNDKNADSSASLRNDKREARAKRNDGGADSAWAVVVSTTTSTGQALARQRFGAERVFFMPFDFAFAVRAFLRVLRPQALVLMESELWPRLLHECAQTGVPVAVVNARVSDRSFTRGMRVRGLWRWAFGSVRLWLAQSAEDARRLQELGAPANRVRDVGNLKFDTRAPAEGRVAERIRKAAAGRPVIVAGSTVGRASASGLSEEEMVVQAWEGVLRREMGAMLVLATRHPERFADAEIVASEFRFVRASDWRRADECTPPFAKDAKDGPPGLAGELAGGLAAAPDLPDADGPTEIVILDTIGDLAAVYGVANAAVVGGSLVARGGHNPLEPAQFGVPVVMGPSYENFRGIVEAMRAADAISIVRTGKTDAGGGAGPHGAFGAATKEGSCGDLSTAAQERASGRDDESFVGELEAELVRLLTDRAAAWAMGERGRKVFEAQQGATARTVEALMKIIVAASEKHPTVHDEAVKDGPPGLLSGDCRPSSSEVRK